MAGFGDRSGWVCAKCYTTAYRFWEVPSTKVNLDAYRGHPCDLCGNLFDVGINIEYRRDAAPIWIMGDNRSAGA